MALTSAATVVAILLLVVRCACRSLAQPKRRGTVCGDVSGVFDAHNNSVALVNQDSYSLHETTIRSCSSSLVNYMQ